MPSLGNRLMLGLPKSSSVFVSLLHTSAVGALPSGSGPGSKWYVPERQWVATSALDSIRTSGTGWPRPHPQVLRNHIVGSRSRVASSGPALVTVIRMLMSVGVAFA